MDFFEAFAVGFATALGVAAGVLVAAGAFWVAATIAL